MGKEVLKYHADDLDRADGIWNLTRKVSDNIALKVCLGLLILLAVMMMLDADIQDGGPEQGLMQLDDIARSQKSSPGFGTFLCEQIAVYASRYRVLYVFLDGKTYFDSGVCHPTGIDASVLDPWDRIKAVIEQSTMRTSETVQACVPQHAECNRAGTTSMSVVNAEAEKDDTTKASLWTMSVMLLLLLTFVYVLNMGITHMSKTLLQPIRVLADDMTAMSQLAIVKVDREMPREKAEPAPKVAEELKQLQDSCVNMRKAIKTWSMYVPPAVVQRLFNKGVQADIGVSRVYTTILFCDIAGFEEACGGLAPSDVLNLFSRALGGIADVIDMFEGTLLEFIGDEVLAVWNTPVIMDNHTHAAVCCALKIHEATFAMPPLQTVSGQDFPIRCRVGVNVCTILAGNIGSSKRLKYGLLGDGINLTARLKGINSRYKTRTLISDKVAADDRVQDAFVCRPIDNVAVKGKKEPTTVYEAMKLRLVGGQEDLTEVTLAASRHTEAFDHYKSRRFTEASQLFNQVYLSFEERGIIDEPSRMLRDRCERYIKEPPALEWDGVERLTKK
jgi:class 3 adenylate cyclase